MKSPAAGAGEIRRENDQEHSTQLPQTPISTSEAFPQRGCHTDELFAKVMSSKIS
jgi:hypothetical protein